MFGCGQLRFSAAQLKLLVVWFSLFDQHVGKVWLYEYTCIVYAVNFICVNKFFSLVKYCLFCQLKGLRSLVAASRLVNVGHR